MMLQSCLKRYRYRSIYTNDSISIRNINNNVNNDLQLHCFPAFNLMFIGN